MNTVRVAIQRLPGVEAVDVSLERAVVDIRLRAGNAITLAQVRDIIKRNGFTSKDAAVTAIGTLVERGGKAALEVSGTKVLMWIVEDATSPDAFRQVQNLRATTGRSVELTGTVISTADQQEQIAVQSFR
jgi:copper chaperone CopZ